MDFILFICFDGVVFCCVFFFLNFVFFHCCLTLTTSSDPLRLFGFVSSFKCNAYFFTVSGGKSFQISSSYFFFFFRS